MCYKRYDDILCIVVDCFEHCVVDLSLEVPFQSNLWERDRARHRSDHARTFIEFYLDDQCDNIAIDCSNEDEDSGVKVQDMLNVAATYNSVDS